jgi:hypothetical protein
MQPRSRLAHQAAHWARGQGRFEDYNAAVFRAFFERGEDIDIRCFKHDPSIKSSLQFLRRTPWARSKVEDLYLRHKRGALESPGKRSRAKSA